MNRLYKWHRVTQETDKQSRIDYGLTNTVKRSVIVDDPFLEDSTIISIGNALYLNLPVITGDQFMDGNHAA